MVLIENVADGSAHDFHHADPPVASELTIRRFDIARTAVVLGSAQSDDDIDHDRCSALDIEVARRRSGGGAVLLVPGHHLWVDVFVSRGHSLWDDDVSRSSHWLGRAWCDTVNSLVSDGSLRIESVPLRLHEGRLVESRWSRKVCFAGVGPGEVVDSRGRKLVGISQRRTREWARLQCIVSISWDAPLMLELLTDPRPTLDDIESWGANIEVSSTNGDLSDVLFDRFVSLVRQLS